MSVGAGATSSLSRGRMAVGRARARLRGDDTLAAVLKSLGARALTLPVTAIASIVTVRIVLEQFGAEGFALYALITTVPLLLPVSDLGLGAAVIDVVARRHVVGDDVVRTVVGVVFTRLVVVAGALTVVAAALGAAGRWHSLLGLPAGDGVERAATLAVVAFSVSVPLSLGLSALLGGGLNHYVVLLQVGTTIAVLGLVAIATVTDGPLWIFPAATGTALAVTGAVSLVLASRRLLLPSGALHLRWRAQSHRIWHTALPMMVLMISLPITYQTARVVLSHRSTVAAVAAYSILFQLYAPLTSIVAAAGRSLWPIYASNRDGQPTTWPELRRVTILFAAGGLALAVPLAVSGGAVGELISDGAISVPGWLPAAFAGLLWCQAVQYPAGMLLTDPIGLRFQAVCSVLMAAAAVALSVWLAGVLGAAGPVVAATIGFVCFLGVPSMVRARAHARQDERAVIDSMP